MAWAIDHVEVDANFEGVPVLLVGDPHVLVDAPSASEEVPQHPWSWLELPSGRALVVQGPGADEDGPWVWVLGSDDGPLSSIEISPRLETSPSGSKPEGVGTIESRSGRLVVGTPESVEWWGPDVDTSRPERAAEMRVDLAPTDALVWVAERQAAGPFPPRRGLFLRSDLRAIDESPACLREPKTFFHGTTAFEDQGRDFEVYAAWGQDAPPETRRTTLAVPGQPAVRPRAARAPSAALRDAQSGW